MISLEGSTTPKRLTYETKNEEDNTPMTVVQKNLANRQSSTTTTSYQSETVKAKSDTSYSSRTTNTHSTASQENPNAKRNKLSP